MFIPLLSQLQKNRADGLHKNTPSALVNRQLADMFQSITNGIIITDTQGKVVFVNPALQNMLKCQANVTYKDIELMFPPEIMSALHEVLTKSNTFHFSEIEVRDRTLEMFLASLHNDQNVVSGGIINLHDVTYRRRVEEALIDQMGKAQTYLEIAGVMYVAINTDNTISLINKRGCEIFGYSLEEIIGKNWYDHFIPKTSVDTLNTHIENLKHKGKRDVEYFESPILTKSGEERVIAWHITLMRNKNNIVISTLLSGKDITERIQAEEKLRESEEKYRSLIANIPNVVWTGEESGRIIFISQNVKKIDGYSQEEMYERGETVWLTSIYDGDLERIKQAYHDLFQKGIPLDVEYRILTRKGKWVWLHNRARSTYVKNGKTLTDGVFSDITARKTAEQALKTERDRSFAILSSISEGLLVVDKDKKLVLINKAAEKLFEIVAKDVAGRDYRDIFSVYKGEDRPPVEERPITNTLKTGEVTISGVTDDYYYQGITGKKIPVQVATAAIIDNGIIAGAVAVFRDMTREKEIDRMKTEFIALASHQLRTPLSAIKWSTETLLDGDAGALNGQQHEYIQDINSATEHMIELVNALLNISRIESGRLIVEPQPTNIKDLVDQIIKELQVKITEKKMKLTVEIQPDLPSINIDPKLIRQVYMNLLTNSLKYSQEGKTIAIAIRREEDKIITEIADSGYGIPKNEQDKVFHKMYRGTNILAAAPEGTGLGLYLVKAIISSSNGHVWFTSEEGKGTAFWFSLPITGMPEKKGEVYLEA